MRRRLDVEMVRRGMAGSRTEAALAVHSGAVTVAGRPAAKASMLVEAEESISLARTPRPFVSRGGEKLDAALDRFGVAASDRLALDAGASTGGFTDCLLSRGAAHVIAVDVGYGQLDWRLRQDPRVTVVERTNVRTLAPEDLAYRPGLITVDVSFISLRLVLPALARCASSDAEFVLLVKPQFEAGRGQVGRGGVVSDPAIWTGVLQQVAAASRDLEVRPLGVMASPLLGPAGNVEFLMHARLGGADPALVGGDPGHFDAAIARAVGEARGLANPGLATEVERSAGSNAS